MLFSFDQLLLLLAVTLTSSAAVSDLRTGLIPDRLVLCFALALAGLRGLGVALGLAPAATLLEDALYGALFAASLPLLLYVCGGLGGGDLKLLVVCGAALGPFGAAHLQLYAFALGAGALLLRLTYRGVLLQTLWQATAVVRGPIQRAGHAERPAQAVCFAPAVCVAALLVMVERW